MIASLVTGAYCCVRPIAVPASSPPISRIKSSAPEPGPKSILMFAPRR
ncbi:Uncharacterised protein [Mycobacteroides abscessus]|nr:Uncharacterised protein [Mycobacteroides abscessus]